MLEIENLTKTFGTQTVISDISMTLVSGKIYGLVGRNGSGKTMLMKMILGFVSPSSGSIKIEGKVLGKDISMPDRIGAIIENPGFLPEYSGFKNLKFLAMIHHKISNEEIKNLTYEQMNKLNNIVNSVSQQVGGVALVNGIETFSMSNITNNNDFNKALFDTLKTIENDTYKLVFSLDLGGKLGYNNTSFNKVDIEQLKALEKEKYKDFENPERLMADYNNWQINDYEGFIKNLKNEYKLLSEDTIISSESRVLYKRYSQYMSDLETNYNKVINEPKYA